MDQPDAISVSLTRNQASVLARVLAWCAYRRDDATAARFDLFAASLRAKLSSDDPVWLWIKLTDRAPLRAAVAEWLALRHERTATLTADEVAVCQWLTGNL